MFGVFREYYLRGIRYRLILIVLLAVFCLQTKADGGGEPTCRKYEEGLYLRTALNDQRGLQQYIDSLNSCSDRSSEMQLTYGRYLYNQQSYEEASDIFKMVLLDQTSSVGQLGEANAYLGLISRVNKETKNAINFFQRAADQGYYKHWSYSFIALTLEDIGNYQKALSYIEQALKENPDYAFAINNKGYIYEMTGMADSALIYYKMADSIANGEDALYRSNMTRRYRDIPDIEKEYESAMIGITRFPTDKRTIYDMCISLANQRRFTEARLYPHKYLEAGPASAVEYYNLGYLYSDVGKVDTAVLYFKKALNLEPTHVLAHNNLAIIYKRWGLFEKAHYHYDIGLAEAPYNEYLINNKVQAYIWQYKFEDALEWIEHYNDLYPDGKYSHLNTGYILMLMERYEEAIPWFNKRLAERPEDERAINSIGRCNAKLGNFDLAIEYFERALKINPSNSYIYHNRASLYTDLEQYNLACSDLKQAIELEYTWLIDSNLIAMQKENCPDVNLQRNILVRAYKGNAEELGNRDFIKLIESYDQLIISEDKEEDKSELNIPTQRFETSGIRSDFQVYPNPSSGEFFVKRGYWDDENLTIKIFDVSGRLIKSISMNQQKIQITLSGQLNGTYLLMIMDERAVLSTQKIVLKD